MAARLRSCDPLAGDARPDAPAGGRCPCAPLRKTAWRCSRALRPGSGSCLTPSSPRPSAPSQAPTVSKEIREAVSDLVRGVRSWGERPHEGRPTGTDPNEKGTYVGGGALGQIEHLYWLARQESGAPYRSGGHPELGETRSPNTRNPRLIRRATVRVDGQAQIPFRRRDDKASVAGPETSVTNRSQAQ